MLRKAVELEDAAAELFKRLDALAPEACKGKSEGATSPWQDVYRAGCGLVVAAEALGGHYRKKTGAAKPGPIQEALGDDELQRIRQHAAAVGNVGSADEDAQRLAEALRTVADEIPDCGPIEREVEWVAAHLHDPSPVLGDAPSRTALSLLLDLRSDDRLRRDFWTISLSKRMSPGERRKPAVFAEDQDTVTANEHDAESYRRLFGDS